MPITNTIDEDRRMRERFSIMVEIQHAQERLERLINATPSGPVRNNLTDANIHLMSAIGALA